MRPAINLFINPYESDRQKEFEYCHWKNKNNPYITRQIKLITGNQRPSYGEFFKLMESYPEDINIIANLDIYFDDSLVNAYQIKENECYALTRWEDIGEIVMFEKRNPLAPAYWSQDVWIFRGSPDKRLQKIDFGMGQPGCDNRLAKLVNDCGIIVSNPRSQIKAIHKHDNQQRPYRDNYRVRGKLLKVYPT